MRFLSSSVVVLVLAWDYLMFTHDSLIRQFALDSFSGFWLYGFAALICLCYLSIPLFGLLADVWIGRHKSILTGVVLCFIAWVIGAISIIIHSYYNSKQLLMMVYGIAAIFEAFGYGFFHANIVQYNIDQLIGASADELSTIIYCHSGRIAIFTFLFRLLWCLFSGKYFNIAAFIVSGVSVSLVLVSHSFFKHKLENISLIKNPIKLIVRVLCYARKHKYPENRSALTYWEEEAPSRLDLGKEKYGGPFTEEEVEDVKTVLRLVLFFIAVVGYAFNFHNGIPVFSIAPLKLCLIASDFSLFLCSFFLLLLYLLIIKVFFYKYIPNMLSRVSIGLIFALAAEVTKLIIIKFIWTTHSFAIIVPQILEGITFVFIVPASLEFTIAQTPIQMRGVMVGGWTASWGIGYLLSSIIRFQFHCQDKPICSSYYYYLIGSIIILLILIVFVILAKRYKYRVRENEVNIVQIVDDHYQKYMEQDYEYQNS